MIQRILALILVQLLLLAGVVNAESANSGSRTPPAAASKKSLESSYLDGLGCLRSSDIPCAQLALAGIPAQSPYAKLLSGNIAAAEKNFDETFRLLLPLQANQTLIPEATASLHASLSLAYENQPDPLRALEHRIQAEKYLSEDSSIHANQNSIWALLSHLPKDQLIDMRGESLNTMTQGWIDLAITAKSTPPLQQKLLTWRTAYPDHPAASFSGHLADKPPATSEHVPSQAILDGKVALLLPFASDAYYPVADAIERGFETSRAAAGGNTEIRIYPTTGNSEEILAIHARAVADGATHIVGPLTREEVTVLASANVPIPTLALNHPENAPPVKNLYAFGLSAENEAAQIAHLARNSGMRVAAIIGTSSPTSLRMAKSFNDVWVRDGGQIFLQARLTKDTDTDALRSQIIQHADMVLIAGGAEDARRIRPFLDIGIPTFGFSRIYAGIRHDPADSILNGVRFIDLPWILNPDDTAYKDYKSAAADLPQGEMQRWFAIGADAYQILLAISQGQPATLYGLTGKMRISAEGALYHELATGRFSTDDVVLEKLPR